MASLKAFLPVLAKILKTTPDALYTRQRALQSLGVLEYREGRGPGSGVALHGDSLAALLIALLGADTLADTDERVAALCRAQNSQGTSFQRGVAEALQAKLAAPEILVTIKVERNVGAEIAVVGSRTKTRQFLIAETDRAPDPAIMVAAEMRSDVVAQVAKAFLISFKENRE